MILLIGMGIGGYFLLRSDVSEDEPAGPPEQTGKLIETTLEERPYVQLIPRADGKEFTLKIANIQNADTIEYELVYLAGDLSRGVIGSINYQGESEVSRDLLLGTCSRNVCKYDEGVEEGSLTLKFRSDEGVRKFVTDFHLQNGTDELTSKDGQFKLGSSKLGDGYILTMPTIGLPSEVEGEVLAGPYQAFSASGLSVKGMGLEVSLEGNGSELVLSLWDGDAWLELEEAVFDQGTLTTEVDSYGPFVVLASSESQE